MHRLLLPAFVCLVACLSASAEVLTNGLPVTAAISAMKKAGYSETGLDMMPTPGSWRHLRFWSVDQGVLIVGYSKASQKVSEMTFWLADERPKAFRQTFELDVASFDSSTGTMTIRTKKGELSGAANRSQPVSSGTNRTSAAAGPGR